MLDRVIRIARTVSDMSRISSCGFCRCTVGAANQRSKAVVYSTTGSRDPKCEILQLNPEQPTAVRLALRINGGLHVRHCATAASRSDQDFVYAMQDNWHISPRPAV